MGEERGGGTSQSSRFLKCKTVVPTRDYQEKVVTATLWVFSAVWWYQARTTILHFGATLLFKFKFYNTPPQFSELQCLLEVTDSLVARVATVTEH